MNYHDNIEKWQAANPLFQESPPEVLFDSDFASKYRELHKDIWNRIIRIHSNILILDTLLKFPFNYIYSPHGMSFWQLTIANTVDSTVILLCALLDDNNGDTNTLLRLKNLCANAEWCDNAQKECYRKQLKKLQFSERTDETRKRMKRLRNTQIAHRQLDESTGLPSIDTERVTLKEMWATFEAVHELFGLVCFGSGYSTLPMDMSPSTTGGKPNKSCLDRVLDAVCVNFEPLHVPERNPELWKQLHPFRDKEDSATFNALRRRIGRREV